MAFSFIIDGVRSENLGIRVNNVSRVIHSPSDIRSIDIPDRFGVYFVRADFGAKSIIVDVSIIGDDFEDVMNRVRSIASALDIGEGLKTLSFDDEPDIEDMAVLSGASDLVQIRKLGRGSLTFFCPNPFSRSVSTEEHNFIASGNVIFNRVGSAVSSPVIRVTANSAIDYVEAHHIGLDQKIVWENYVSPMSAGEVLLIDNVRNLVTRQGLRNMNQIRISSRFFYLEKNSNTVVVSVTTGESAGVKLEYRPYWL